MRLRFSERSRSLPYSGIREIFDLANTMHDVVHLEIGEPGFDTPRPIIEAAMRSALAGDTHYTSSMGSEQLRRLIAEHLVEQHGVGFRPNEVVVTAGGMEALLLAMLTLLDSGDEVILPSPHWPNYPAHVMLAGGRCANLQLQKQDSFVPSKEQLKRLISRDTKVLLLNYPHNPTGAVLTDSQLEVLADIAVRHDLIVVSDEAYGSLVFDGRETASIISQPGMKDRTILVGTCSKTFAMTGWRVGWLVAAPELASRASRLHEHTSACASSVSQAAAMAALRLPRGIVDVMIAEYESRRDLMITELMGIPGLVPIKPQGTFYMMVDISSLGIPSLSLSHTLLSRARVAVAPGSAFGAEGEGYLRLCFASCPETIREGTRRIRQGLETVV